MTLAAHCYIIQNKRLNAASSLQLSLYFCSYFLFLSKKTMRSSDLNTAFSK